MRVGKLSENATLPTRKHRDDAGLDLYALVEPIDSIVSIPFGESAIIRTGITVEIPRRLSGYIWPKSRSNFLIGGGVIDPGYTGEILVKIINPLRTTVTIQNGDAIAQLVLCATFPSDAQEVPLERVHRFNTDRGATGGIVSQTNVEN